MINHKQRIIMVGLLLTLMLVNRSEGSTIQNPSKPLQQDSSKIQTRTQRQTDPTAVTSFASYNWTSVNAIIEQAITEHAFPGASLTVSFANQSNPIFHQNYGHLTYFHQLNEISVSNDTLYDVASVTKVMATSLNIMNMLSSHSIELQDKVSKYIENYDTNKKTNTTIGNLLLHNAGLPYDYPGTLPDDEGNFLDYIRFIKPVHPVGTAFQYSNLGFYLLGKIVQKVTNKTFDRYFQQNKIFAGLYATQFNPPKNVTHLTAPCEYDSEIRKQIVRGQAHERVAYKYGGVAGHSGLFTTGLDINRFMRILLNKGKLPESFSRTLPESIVEKFTTPVNLTEYSNTRAYGFDTVCPGESMKGKKCFRHDGSTGIVAMADKERQIVIVLMCNRGHPDVKNVRNEAYKGRIVDEVMKVLGV